MVFEMSAILSWPQLVNDCDISGIMVHWQQACQYVSTHAGVTAPSVYGCPPCGTSQVDPCGSHKHTCRLTSLSLWYQFASNLDRQHADGAMSTTLDSWGVSNGGMYNVEEDPCIVGENSCHWPWFNSLRLGDVNLGHWNGSPLFDATLLPEPLMMCCQYWTLMNKIQHFLKKQWCSISKRWPFSAKSRCC